MSLVATGPSRGRSQRSLLVSVGTTFRTDITNKEYNFSFTVFTIQWISSIKCHFCSNQVTIMTNFKFV
jgi:hypothetical protein